jgi:hypothetical protein
MRHPTGAVVSRPFSALVNLSIAFEITGFSGGRKKEKRRFNGMPETGSPHT